VKGFLVFCIVLSSVVLIGLALPYLDSRGRAHEQRLVGALNFTEKAIEAALRAPADVYEPAIAPGSSPDHWTLSGLVVSRNELNGGARAPFVARLRSVCSDPGAARCWQTVELVVDGLVLPSRSAANLIGDGAMEATADETGGPRETGDERSVPAAARLGDQAASASSSADDAMPALAKDPIEAAAPAEIAPTPGELAEDPVSGPDLILFIQDALKKLRYEPGPVDGKLGARTTAAIRAYQEDYDLPQDGRATPALLRHMRRQLGDLGQQSRNTAGAGA